MNVPVSPEVDSEVSEQSAITRLVSNCSLDRVGMWVSGACAIHCAALPLLITIAGLGWLGDERFEWSIIAVSFLIASMRLFHSYLFEHRRPIAVLLFVTGATSILFAKSEIVGWEYAEMIGMTLGGSIIALAHWRNHQLVRPCARHSH